MFEPRIVVLQEVVWDGEGPVKFVTDDGGVWCSAKRKDFWQPDKDWESIIVPGIKMRFWTVQWSTVIGFEVLVPRNSEETSVASAKTLGSSSSSTHEWVSVWCMANNFQTKAERKAGEEAYVKFIEDEGNKIAQWIDEGKNLKEINELISDGHTGNTHAWALNLGTQRAKNQENAKKVRREHNEYWGVKEDTEGLVNPAVMTIKE